MFEYTEEQNFVLLGTSFFFDAKKLDLDHQSQQNEKLLHLKYAINSIQN